MYKVNSSCLSCCWSDFLPQSSAECHPSLSTPNIFCICKNFILVAEKKGWNTLLSEDKRKQVLVSGFINTFHWCVYLFSTCLLCSKNLIMAQKSKDFYFEMTLCTKIQKIWSKCFYSTLCGSSVNKQLWEIYRQSPWKFWKVVGKFLIHVCSM